MKRHKEGRVGMELVIEWYTVIGSIVRSAPAPKQFTLHIIPVPSRVVIRLRVTSVRAGIVFPSMLEVVIFATTAIACGIQVKRERRVWWGNISGVSASTRVCKGNFREDGLFPFPVIIRVLVARPV
jgi:hypothetical protein